MLKKRLISLLVASMVIIMSFGSTIVMAADSDDSKASVGSVALDIDAEADKVTGKDTVQNKQSEYSDEIDINSTEGCEVYATLPSSFTVVIPKKVILTGSANGSGAYTVKVKGDIAGNETITVAPAATVAMKQTGKTDVTATIAQPKTTWTVADAGLAAGVITTGTITAAGLTAGSWAGAFNFDISLK